MPEPKPNRYQALIGRIFHDHFKKGMTEFEFERSELSGNAKKLGIRLPDNLGDVIYSFRYRTALPDEIVKTATAGREWIIEPAGRSRYRFKLARVSRIIPNAELLSIKIPDATPEIITANALSDEQALLAKVRYNRLIDIFLGITTYSLQSHLRTTVPNMGQIEIDEQFMVDDVIALFELAMRGDDVKIAEERHYQLVPADSIQAEDLKTYATR